MKHGKIFTGIGKLLTARNIAIAALVVTGGSIVLDKIDSASPPRHSLPISASVTSMDERLPGNRPILALAGYAASYIVGTNPYKNDPLVNPPQPKRIEPPKPREEEWGWSPANPGALVVKRDTRPGAGS